MFTHSTGLLIYPMKAFLMVSGGIEKDQWHKMSLTGPSFTQCFDYLLQTSFP